MYLHTHAHNYVSMPCILMSISFVCVVSDSPISLRPYDELEASTAEFIEGGLQISEAATDHESSGAIVCRNRLFEPHNIRQHCTRDCGNVSLCLPPRV